MLHVSNLSKRYGELLLFEKVSFDLNSGDRMALIGPNGCGKTTLLRLIMGLEPPDTGSARFAVPLTRVGYLPQALDLDVYPTVEQALAGLHAQPVSYWESEVERLAVALASADADGVDAIEREYAHALDGLTHAATTLPPHELEAVLAGLGLQDLSLEQSVALLSGGQKTRLGLARLLVQHPALLILDEPTNHLDLTALTWLEDYLRTYDGAMLLVSHDRAFLDRVVSSVLEIDPLTHQAKVYPGAYSAYAEAKVREREAYLQRYQEQQERIADLEAAAERWKAQARNIEGETINFYYKKRAKKVARQAVMRVRRVERLLESEDHLDKPRQSWTMRLDLGVAAPSGQDVLSLEHLTMGFGERRLFTDVNLILQRGERIVLVGPNGSGKTTLLRLITGQLAPLEGTVRLGSNVKLGYLAQEQETLAHYASPLDAVLRVGGVSETEARTFLHQFLFAGDEVHTAMPLLSFGQRARLNLGLLVLEGCNLLLLDEPTNHLDIPSRETFEQALDSFEGTVLAVVHDRYFIEHLASAVWALREGTIRRYPDLAQALAGQGQAAGEPNTTPGRLEDNMPPTLMS
ncbi:MAG: ribosomal protection-like ABC-F family protein [Anaerolineales bacterium]